MFYCRKVSGPVKPIQFDRVNQRLVFSSGRVFSLNDYVRVSRCLPPAGLKTRDVLLPRGVRCLPRPPAA